MASLEVSRRQLTGVVVSAGKMINTVKVRIAKQEWNKRIQKYYSAPKTLMVSDPTNSTREGDVVLLEGGRRISKNVRHVIADVVAPMGPPMAERAAIPTAVERLAAVEAARAAKDLRQAERGRWPALERIREREAKQEVLKSMQEMGISSPAQEHQQQQGGMNLSDFFGSTNRQRKSAGVELRDFFDMAKRELQGNEGKLANQPKKLQEARRALQAELNTLMLQMAQAKQWEQESIGRERLQILKRIRKVEESRARYVDYIRHIDGKRAHYFQHAFDWFELVKALGLQAEEQKVVALDLWGNRILQSVQEDSAASLPEEAVDVPVTKAAERAREENAIAAEAVEAERDAEQLTISKEEADRIIGEIGLDVHERESQPLVEQDKEQASLAADVDSKVRS